MSSFFLRQACLGLLIAFTLSISSFAQNPGSIEIESSIKIGTDDRTNPPAGTIRWNPSTGDFEGFDGSEWLSLTKSNNWGRNVSLENQKFESFNTKGGYGFSLDISGDLAIRCEGERRSTNRQSVPILRQTYKIAPASPGVQVIVFPTSK